MLHKQLIKLSFLLFLGVALAARAEVAEVAAFKGGLDIPRINRCMDIVEMQCDNLRTFREFYLCAAKVMQEDSECQQNYALFQHASGFFDVIRPYTGVAVVRAKVLAADHSENYFMIDNHGELVTLTDQVNLTDSAFFNEIQSRFPQASLWPITIDFPRSESRSDGGTDLIFKQLLLNGCKACEIAGYAEISYSFAPDGRFLNTALEAIIAPIQDS